MKTSQKSHSSTFFEENKKTFLDPFLDHFLIILGPFYAKFWPKTAGHFMPISAKNAVFLHQNTADFNERKFKNICYTWPTLYHNTFHVSTEVLKNIQYVIKEHSINYKSSNCTTSKNCNKKAQIIQFIVYMLFMLYIKVG